MSAIHDPFPPDASAQGARSRGGFPDDDYTPHGYLANPFSGATSWNDGDGGVLRSSRDTVGLGWRLTWALGAQAGCDVVVMLPGEARAGGLGTPLRTRAEFDAVDLVSPHHSSRLLAYRWRAFERIWEARFTLVRRDTLGLEIVWETSDEDRAPTAGERCSGSRSITDPVQVVIALVGWRVRTTSGMHDVDRAQADGPGGHVTPAKPDRSAVAQIDLGAPYGSVRLQTAALDAACVGPAALDAPGLAPGLAPGFEGREDVACQVVGLAVTVSTACGATHALASRQTDATGAGKQPDPTMQEREVGMLVGASAVEAFDPAPVSSDPASAVAAESPGEVVRAAVERAYAEDDAFWRGAARLVGDWPSAWRRGWVYDLETTRMCVMPPGGVFCDVWPAWMIQWPRAVVAEGTLDMVRLAYASPVLAQRALLSLFRDAPAPNVPCIFQGGEPNMVAKDGSVCGTSPAWCIPFYNLERLYALTGDRGWLAAIYPYLTRYAEWWLAERTDAAGWAVYRCTWEAGEDDTPRLDPERTGDNVVSAYVRPVELQAAMAQSAGVLARFAEALGKASDAEYWHTVAAQYAERTRQLWDPGEGRFRDWDARHGRFLAPSGEANYWGIDPCRYSALAFTPLLAGIADRDQTVALVHELDAYSGPPWTLWPSWSYVVLEAGLAAGARALTGRIAAEIVDRVYAELDVRTVPGTAWPTPGVAREYWPLDLSTWGSCEGYGWGANTASLLVRQVFGFLEGAIPVLPHRVPRLPASCPETHDPFKPPPDSALPTASALPRVIDSPAARPSFALVPNLPPSLLAPGRRYGLAQLPLHGLRLDILYVVPEPDTPPTRHPTPGGSSHEHVTLGAALEIVLTTDTPTRCSASDEGGAPVYWTASPRRRHQFRGYLGCIYLVTLQQGDA
ncbi:MAG: hypothetical protein IT305_07515 [Chloroflexi bacterium]|nr:hypothetical protein [Chloroflexota bacterium]